MIQQNFSTYCKLHIPTPKAAEQGPVYNLFSKKPMFVDTYLVIKIVLHFGASVEKPPVT